MIPICSNVVSGVAISIVSGEAKMALMKRSMEGFWCHIAGKVEVGEAGWQAIVREFFEETKIVVEELYSGDYIEQFYVAKENRIDMIPVFVVYCPPDQKIVLNHEHTEYKWCSLDEAKSLVPYPNQKALYEHVWNNFVVGKPSSYMRIETS